MRNNSAYYKANYWRTPVTYISGKITGNEANYKEQFAKAAEIVRKMGLEPMVPIEDETPENVAQWKAWEDYMKKDIKKLLECDSIFMIGENMTGQGKDWRTSRGAKIEWKLALDLNYKIYYSDDEELKKYF